MVLIWSALSCVGFLLIMWSLETFRVGCDNTKQVLLNFSFWYDCILNRWGELWYWANKVQLGLGLGDPYFFQVDLLFVSLTIRDGQPAPDHMPYLTTNHIIASTNMANLSHKLCYLSMIKTQTKPAESKLTFNTQKKTY